MNTNRPLALAGQSLSEKCRKSLSDMGFEVVILPPFSRLGEWVDTHADLMLFQTDGKIFMYRELIDMLPPLISSLESRGYAVVSVDTPPSGKYPDDIALNWLRVGRYIFCKKSHVAREVSEYTEKMGYTVVNVNQGYARCNACPVSDSGIITADPSLLRAASNVGVDTLSVSAGNVELSCYEYGFIGGACGVFEDKVYFSGDIYSHPDGKKIVEFCRARGIEVFSLSDEPLRDVGSIFFF